MGGRRPPLTTDRRLGPGAVLRSGGSGPYRAIEIIDGEPHLIREDVGGPGPGDPPQGGRPLLCLVHVTDLQLADVQSPTRFEFLNRHFGDPRYAKIVPVQRPQEALTAHAIDATLRTLNEVRGPATGHPPQLAVTTGDAIDNAQWNEMQNFLSLFDGGLVRPDSGGPGYEGVQAQDWPDDIFWRPDGPGLNGHDIFRSEFGFPHHPGLMERALREFSATGLRIPWLSCFGNHEAFHQGVGVVTGGLAEALVGDRKPLRLAVTTGDAIDNAQWNEMQNFLALFDGGQVRPDSGGPRYEGVQAQDWPDDIFWRPDGPGLNGHDIFRSEFGFPHHPGLLQRALREFAATGLRIPWLSCFGNHEAFHQGVGAVTGGLAEALVGDRKPLRLPAEFDHDLALELFTERPEAFMGGPALEVTADPSRRAITRREFVEAHFRPGARPPGHGFTEQNRLDGTAYYVHDTLAARFIALDTNCATGGAAGAIDQEQARWLEARLAEAHAAYRGPDGREIRTGHDDRLVVLFSHHGIDTIISAGRTAARAAAGPLLGTDELLTLVHRFPNVVLWLNGHTHTNAIRPRRDPDHPARGFWEVTTCAIVDWPCQARLIELIDADGYLSIVCTMVDHDSPVAPRCLETVDDLASLHRELAANVPYGGATSGLSGAARDRNVELRIAPPFPLDRVATGLASSALR